MYCLLATESMKGLQFFSADQVLSPYVYVFYAAYLVSLAFTPIVRHIAVYYDIIDRPDGIRKMHTSPVAYLGGVAVFLGWLAGLAISQFIVMHRVYGGYQTVVVNFAIVVAACTIVMLGLWDDILHMSPWKKILGQMLAAGILLLFGIGRGSAWVFMGPLLTRTCAYWGWPAADPGAIALLYNHWLVDVASVIFVMVLVVGCCNAANLMDGLDGLCGGVTAIISAGFLFLAVNLAMQSGALDVNQDALRVVLGLALLGAVLGFVPFNFNPASIFMGDTGSMFLGYACSLMMILFASGGHFKWLLASLVMFSLPLLDTALAFVRRWVNNRPIFSPDRFHLHHQLVARGFTVKQTVIISYGLSIIFCLLGAAVVYVRARYAVAVYLVVFGSTIVAAVKMGMVHERCTPVKAQPLSSGGISSTGGSVEDGTALEISTSSSDELASSLARRLVDKD